MRGGCRGCIKTACKPVEALSKSIPNKEDVSSKSVVKKVGTLSKSTPKKLEASPKSPTKKVETSPKSTAMVEGLSKSTAQKVESSSKSSTKKLEPPSKSAARKKITTKKMEASPKSTAKNVETSPKSADKKVVMSRKSTAEVVTSSKSTAKVGITSKSVVKKVITSPKSTVKNVEASNSMVRTSSKPTPLNAKKMKSSEKHVAPLKSNSITVCSVSSMNASGGSNGESNSKLKMEKRAASLKVAARKLMTPLRAPLPSKSSLSNNGVVSINAREHKNLKIASHSKNQLKTRKFEHKKPGNDAVVEKTLYVIKMESGNKSLQTDRDTGNNVAFSPHSSSPPKFSSSSQESKEESEYTTSEGKEDSFSVNPEGELMKSGEALEVKDIGQPRMVRIVSSEEKASQISALTFRRGKLVELQSEITSPRRLKFRRATGSGDNAMVKAESLRSFKRRYESGIDRMGTPTGPEKVVLRRQGTQGKRDGHGLFNNVIEETANKLAEIRKSKVKALVGAFESIISLQERKPAVKTIS
ncbi:muscle M-line assembly protein unc-89-like [Neltuma alba]|uniref:muscle M-line assembly protein unc-89-like n=1 Tax=Neltuma alba TaxID=207710 RepID=UPI0010A494A2|nr:muscle M-line assembly protein unc-89-like [Prosopis alba]